MKELFENVFGMNFAKKSCRKGWEGFKEIHEWEHRNSKCSHRDTWNKRFADKSSKHSVNWKI